MPFTTQTLEEFYRTSLSGPKQTGPEHHFSVADIAERLQGGELYPTYIRRDFYKIMLFRGDAQFHFGDETIAISGDSLLFFNPRVPYTYASLPPDAQR